MQVLFMYTNLLFWMLALAALFSMLFCVFIRKTFCVQTYYAVHMLSKCVGDHRWEGRSIKVKQNFYFTVESLFCSFSISVFEFFENSLSNIISHDKRTVGNFFAYFSCHATFHFIFAPFLDREKKRVWIQ